MKRKRYFSDGSFIPASAPNFQRFKVKNKVITDSEVYFCYDQQNKGQEVVVKAEKIGQRKHSAVDKEWSFYKKLSKCEDFDIALEKFIGIDHRFLIMKKRGIDLKKYYKKQIKAGL